ncbi:rab-GTPase-TBC domain-containing protein [Xylariales sp. PMI_506]|nr:rab-GTPase-TBC domain-containing protein [Xylariales sp. PMI_506]
MSKQSEPGQISQVASTFDSTEASTQIKPEKESRENITGLVSEVEATDDDGTEQDRAKALVILDACTRGDIGDLSQLALSKGGFLSDAIRCQAWPILLGSTLAADTIGGEVKPTSKSTIPKRDDPTSSEKSSLTDVDGAASSSDTPWRELPRHRDEDQVRLDVDRSFIYYPNDQSQAQLEVKKAELSDLITETLRRQSYLCYFQGYHDICQVFLLVLPAELRAAAVARLSVLRIRDFMLPNLVPALAQLRLIPDILAAVDPALYRHLSRTEPFFALSGTLTMYAHDIQSYSSIARLFDVLLAREQVFSVYMFAQIVLNRREELFDTPDTEPEMLHSILSKLPQPLDLDQLIADTETLYRRHPPKLLRSWGHISRASVLKTTRDPVASAAQSLGDGRRFFERQVKELQWAESRDKMLKTMWAYRRPASRVALAVVVGMLAVYLRKSPSTWAYVTSFLRW